jgi:hypothetical protein
LQGVFCFFVARCLAVAFAFFAAEEVLSENDEEDKQSADINTEQASFENNHQKYDNPKYIAT